jgi:hypothetical protein
VLEKGHATFIAVREPTIELPKKYSQQFIRETATRVITALGKPKHQEYQLKARVNKPQSAESKIYPRRPLDIYITAPSAMKDYVQEAQRQVEARGRKKTPVFISQRFHGPKTREGKIVSEVYYSLEKNGCYPLVASPDPKPAQGQFAWQQVMAKMCEFPKHVLRSFLENLEIFTEG